MVSLLSDLKQRGVWRSYDQHVLRLEPILQAMTRRGIPVDPTRYAEVKAELTAEVARLEQAMQAMVPDEVRPFHPKDGYKRPPVDIPQCAPSGSGITKVIGNGGSIPTFLLRTGDHKGRAWPEPRWVKLDEWCPSGGKNGGLIRYMKFKGHKVPTDWKSGKETTAELGLTRLAKSTGDPLYKLVRERSDLSTLLTNHVKNWKPGSDGRVHPLFYYDTATGQLAARKPNSMNAPHHKESQGPIFRSMIIAPPGHTIVEWDYKGFHSLVLGFCARDLNLMRMTRIDVHSFVTAHLKHLPNHERCHEWADADLAVYLSKVKREYKHDRDAKVKHAFLGYNNGMGYRKLYNVYMEYFESQSEAKRVMALLDSLFPQAKVFREQVCAQAHEQGYLISRAGSIRYFFEVYKAKYNKEGVAEWSHGPDQEAAKSYFQQNLSHGHLKDAMIRLDDAGLLEQAGVCTPIHDAIIGIVPNHLLATVIPAIASEMEKPSTILVDPVSAPNGLSVGVSVKLGKCWKDMVELKDWSNAEEIKRAISAT